VLHFPFYRRLSDQDIWCPVRSGLVVKHDNSSPSREDSGRFTMIATYQTRKPPREFR
jgi:hypothetical protein